MSLRTPAKSFGLLPPEAAAKLTGLQFLHGLIDGSIPAPPFAEPSDLWPVEAEKGRVVFEAMPSVRFYNPLGIVHGGWITLVLDTVMGCAVTSVLDAGKGATTIELKTIFMRPVLEKTGKLRCEGTLLHAGGRVASAEGKLFDGNGRLVAHGTETCFILDTTKR